ncbi:hypothetical protein EJ04DRAFT_569675 [Polyplosphaeria fusca]|uniref:Uncharacterized protein n=1 Tax=Polyplosphaeria fusca TaxID=682080 RepID=A0A9P4QMA4_9PLEO|nr:hypothetical protein EJ04DRAFT_569675 [Polyplosphaeria fusca]
MAIFESSKDIYERVCRLGKLPAPADDDLLDCVKKIGLIQNRLGRRYFIFGGTSCKMLAGAMRDTANVNIVLEKGSLKIPNPRDWLEQEPFFWSQQEEKYVFVVLRDSHVDGSQPDILCQGRCFVELKVRGAGRRFDDIHKDLVTLPGTSAKSLPRCELLKLKMSGWALKSRREGPKRKNDMIDILALRTTMSLEGERLDLTVGGMYATRAGLSEWLREFDDFKAWPLLLHTGRGNISQDASKSIAL